MSTKASRRTVQHLRVQAETEGWSILAPDSAPALEGPSTNDWACPECGAILALGIADGQVLDILLRCYGCGVVCALPVRRPGQPLPTRHLSFSAGTYRISKTIPIMNPSAGLVGQTAIDGYRGETGYLAPGEVPSSVITEWSPLGLRTLASKAVEMLGAEFDRLRASDEKGKASTTPPARRHRLIELVDYALTTATVWEAQGENDPMILDGNVLAELGSTISFIERWKNHPAWSRLVDTLSNATEGQHTVMLLAVASYLVDAGNGVGIVVDDGGRGRVADLWLEPTLAERLDLEVKTPLALRGPRTKPLQRQEALTIIKKLVKDAASTGHGQLSAKDSGVLAIGAFHLGLGGIDTLEAAARDVLNEQKGHKQHLAAIVVSELTYQETTVVDESGAFVSGTFNPVIQIRVVQHTSYTGSLTIGTAG